MRTTLTLDDDVEQRLRSLVRKTGKSFKQLVNDLLRVGMERDSMAEAAPAFRVQARPMGLRAGYSLDDISGLLERIEREELA